jgi:UDP-2,3-diacylglucosamine pyrophosphatase LpxH
VSLGSSRESLLVFSDVHLGSDLNDGPGTTPRRTATIDRDLVALVAHYRRARPAADRWHIVIAGDFIDFAGMTIAPDAAALETALTEEEREHGVGSAADHVRLKLRRVVARHRDLFAELAGFVADGHALTLVHGNHDVELHWVEVQRDFRDVLWSHSGQARAAGTEPSSEPEDAFRARIDFQPWFFYREGVVYIEHGHQYDPFCSTTHVMSPLHPLDPRRVVRGFSDVLLRYVVRQTRGLKEHGHETLGLADYVGFGVKLGVSGMFALVVRFVRAILELFRLRRAYVSEAARVLRDEHVVRCAKLAEAMRIGRDRIDALLALQAPPITSSIRGILASVLLDKLALGLAALLILAGLALFGAFHGYGWLGAFGVLVAWSLLHRHLSQQRQVDSAAQLQIRAGQLASLFQVAFVVMGHTHAPVVAPAGSATYVNLGSWAEEADDDGDGRDGPSSVPPATRAARTHLVLHMTEGRPEAELCGWSSEEGVPRSLGTPSPARQATQVSAGEIQAPSAAT